jgi:hypothetical protein
MHRSDQERLDPDGNQTRKDETMDLETYLMWKGAGVAMGLVIGVTVGVRRLVREFGFRGTVRIFAALVGLL